jgi:hypothetical protein
MAEHGTTTHSTNPTTPEAYLADRERVWSGFTNATLVGIIFMVVLLVGMAVFLL